MKRRKWTMIVAVGMIVATATGWPLVLKIPVVASAAYLLFLIGEDVVTAIKS